MFWLCVFSKGTFEGPRVLPTFSSFASCGPWDWATWADPGSNRHAVSFDGEYRMVRAIPEGDRAGVELSDLVTAPDIADIEREKLGRELDASYDKMSAFVCEHGPLLLTRGMTPLEANTAIMACLEKLKYDLDEACTR